jgi:ABC-2 type transport system permease protein
VGFSTATASSRLAVAGAVGVYFLFVPLWGAVRFPIQLYFGLSGGPSWLPVSGGQFLRFLTLLNPTGSFKILSNAFLSGSLFAGNDARVHVAAALMLLAWILVPPLLGLLRFEVADL